MAGATLAQLTRASMMSASLAVIVLLGGRAMVAGPVSDSSAPPVAARAVTAAVSAHRAGGGTSAGGGAGGGVGDGRAAASGSSRSAGASAVACSTAVQVATQLQLQHVSVPAVANDPKHLRLLGTLTEAASGRPVTGAVTLWRRTRTGVWKSVLAHRMTSVDGIVLLDVDQSGARAVYRMTFAGDAAYAPSASDTLTVTRH